MKVVGACVCLLALACVGAAQDCRRVATGTAYYRPTYEAVYTPPVSLSYAADGSELALKLFDAYKAAKEGELAAKEREINLYKSIIAGGGAVPPVLREAVKPPDAGLTLLRNDCARCHAAEDGAAKGKKHVFFKAGELIASDVQAGDMVREVQEGTMPADKKWTDAEKAAFGFYMLRRPPVPAK